MQPSKRDRSILCEGDDLWPRWAPLGRVTSLAVAWQPTGKRARLSIISNRDYSAARSRGPAAAAAAVRMERGSIWEWTRERPPEVGQDARWLVSQFHSWLASLFCLPRDFGRRADFETRIRAETIWRPRARLLMREQIKRLRSPKRANRRQESHSPIGPVAICAPSQTGQTIPS